MDNLTTLKRKRGYLKGQVSRIESYLGQISEETGIDEDAIQDRLDKLEGLASKFDELQSEIEAHREGDQVVAEDAERDDFEERLYRLRGLGRTFIKGSQVRKPVSEENGSLETSIRALADHQARLSDILQQVSELQMNAARGESGMKSHGASSVQTNVRLPTVTLPTFSGNYMEWINFRDLFQSMINERQDISNAQRMQYLQGSLRGEAASLLRHLPVTDANYTVAWTSLKLRYEKEKFIIEAHIRSIMEQPKLKEATQSGIKMLYSGVREALNALEALKVPVHQWDWWLFFVVVSKLDPESRQLWARETANTEKPKFEELCTFIFSRICELETINGNVDRHRMKESRRNVSTVAVVSCVKCQGDHHLKDCPTFQELPMGARRKLVADGRLCFICLNPNHVARQCKFSGCQICKRRHNTVLHQQEPEFVSANPGSFQTLHSTIPQGQVLLPTVSFLVPDASNNMQICRALLDSGSQATLITEACMQRLGLSRSKSRVAILGIDTTKEKRARGTVRLILKSRLTAETVQVYALILRNITCPMPHHNIAEPPWRNNELADPHYYKSGPIDILIGADVFFECLKDGQRKLSSSSHLLARNTIFGWVIGGRHWDQPQEILVSCHVAIEDLLQRFWQLEEAEFSTTESAEDGEIETHFVKTHRRTEEGRYSVSYPFKDDPEKLGDSVTAAKSRLMSMERKFQRDAELKKAYVEFMDDYQQQGHMVESGAMEDRDNIEGNFLAHHAVHKLESTTTKTRVVFDASMLTSSLVSLNDVLMKGPVIQPELTTLLVGFRLHKIGLTADIRQMNRQILINEEDCRYQQILWRRDPAKPITIFELRTVTYGTTSAPFQATRVLQQLADDEEKRFPEVAGMIRQNFYMDDFIGGADTVEEALKVTEELSSLLAAGGFELRKWASSAEEVVRSLPAQVTEYSVTFKEEQNSATKILGPRWIPGADVFSFKVSLEPRNQHTKRSLLSEIARIFDPLGWLAPGIISAKILFQSLWLINVDWDEPLPPAVMEEWKALRTSLRELERLKIPRSKCSGSDKLRIIGFSDASEKAYAAVLYLQAVNGSGEYKSHILCSKTKVAPLQQISIPRLELCGAHLLAKIMGKYSRILGVTLADCHPYTDSTIVLSWLAEPPRKWKTFVANRTADILRRLPQVQWRHIISKNNPADCASRGISVEELLKLRLWWKGPDFLMAEMRMKTEHISYPKESTELRCHATVRQEEINPVFLRYSRLTKLLRIIAWCRRWLRRKEEQRSLHRGILRSEEVEQARLLMIKLAQADSFRDELRILGRNHQLPASSRLMTLKAFVDEHGIARVGGRLEEAEWEFSRKHPVILDAAHPFAALIIDELHLAGKHAGPQLLETLLNQRYHILGGRKLIKRRVRNCVICTRYRAKVIEQQMGDLPPYRVRVCRAFLNTGVDYAGPVTVRAWKGRGGKRYKAYIALFVCMTTKAIHLELVSELSTEAFLAALRRFAGRRGFPARIFSDNGTNFVGAKRELGELQALLKTREHHEAIANYLTSQECEWHFIPPGSPHFGGLWEAGVKAMKFHLRREIGDAQFTFEEYQTLLCQIEACLNSRPLCSRNIQDGNVEVLTPGHFLIGESLKLVPDRDLQRTQPGHLTRFNYIQRIQQLFWRRWQNEYLANLQGRYKWKQPQRDIQLGQLVIIREEQLPPGKWATGVIQEVHRGKDGLIRVVTVRTTRGTLKRSIGKLIPLHQEDEV